MATITRLGVLLIVAGLGVDVVAHSADIMPLEWPAHFTGFIGMLVLIGGVVHDGIRATRQPIERRSTRAHR